MISSRQWPRCGSEDGKHSPLTDTNLGEAVHGNPTERFADMLGIASVISNRATLAKVTPEQIVSAPGQFDAYGKALPPGTEAERAWTQVQTIGPITAATYYSTPEAQKINRMKPERGSG